MYFQPQGPAGGAFSEEVLSSLGEWGRQPGRAVRDGEACLAWPYLGTVLLSWDTGTGHGQRSPGAPRPLQEAAVFWRWLVTSLRRVKGRPAGQCCMQPPWVNTSAYAWLLPECQ